MISDSLSGCLSYKLYNVFGRYNVYNRELNKKIRRKSQNRRRNEMMALYSLSRLSEFFKKQFITTINTTAVRRIYSMAMNLR